MSKENKPGTPMTPYQVVDRSKTKLNRRVASLLRRWSDYSNGMFTQRTGYAKDAFEELCVLYKDRVLDDIPFGDTMEDYIKDLCYQEYLKLEDADQYIIMMDYREDCEQKNSESDWCFELTCFGCYPFQEHLYRCFEDYLTDYTNERIDKDFYGG